VSFLACGTGAALFGHKTLRSRGPIIRDRTNPLYTAITAIGLARDDAPETPDVVDRASLLTVLHRTALRDSTPITVAIAALWALAAWGDARAPSVLERVERRLAADESSSMDLGMLLSALAAAHDADLVSPTSHSRIATIAKTELLSRFSDSGQLFRGRSSRRSPANQIYGGMTSFASQVYPIHGLTEFARVTNTEVPQRVVRVADRIAETQGPRGQWWWVYSPTTGSVLDGYPVYVVHQHGMAFMALAPLENLGLRNYRAHLALGLRWVFGENELDISLVDHADAFICRAIQRRGADPDGHLGMSRAQRGRLLLTTWGLGPPRTQPSPERLEVLEECRPYELGWLLYARSLILGW
jgi:hypothetical protein